MSEPLKPQRAGRRWLVYAALGLAAMALYAQTLGFGLVGIDDPWLLGDNTLLQRSDGASLGATLSAIFFDLSPLTRYRLGAEYLPVRDLSVLLDFALWGPRYGAHHGTNVLLYALSAMLLCAALRRWLADLWLAAAVSALWLAHPLHVESVAWLAERKGLLAALFAFAALWAFHGALRRGGLWRWLSVALLLVAAIWSKGLAIATVGVLTALLWLRLGVEVDAETAEADANRGSGRSRRAAWLGLAALAGVALAAFVPLWLAGRGAQMVAGYHGGSFGATAALMSKGHALYLWRGLLGGPLGIDYGLPPGIAGQPLLFAVGLLSLLIITATLLWALLRARARSRRPALVLFGLAAACWLAYLLPVSQILVPLQNALADRYLLLPSLGICLAVAAIVFRWIPRRVLRGLAIGALLVAELASTLLQARSWRSDEALYRQTLQVNPRSLTALLQLSRLARQRGEFAASLALLERARRSYPQDGRVQTHAALVALQQKQTGKALGLLRQAVQDPRCASARINLALLLSAQAGRQKEALRYAREATQLRPRGAKAWLTLGVAALRAGLLDEAEAALDKALKLRPGYATAHYNRAVLAQRRGQPKAARAALRETLRWDPKHGPARALLGRLGTH